MVYNTIQQVPVSQPLVMVNKTSDRDQPIQIANTSNHNHASPSPFRLSTQNWLSRQEIPDIPSHSQPSPLHSSSPPNMHSHGRSSSTALSNDRPVRVRNPVDRLATTTSTYSTRPKRQAQPLTITKAVDTHARTRGAATVLATNTHLINQPLHSGSGSYQNSTGLHSDDKDAEGEEDDGGDEGEEEDGAAHVPCPRSDSASEYLADKHDQEGDESSHGRPTSDTGESAPGRNRGRTKARRIIDSGDETHSPPRNTRSKPAPSDSDPEYGEEGDPHPSRSTRSNRLHKIQNLAQKRMGANGTNGAVRRSTRRLKIHEDESESGRAPQNTQEEVEARNLRKRETIHYYEVPPLPALESNDTSRSKKSRPHGKDVRLRLNMSGKELDQMFGHARPGHDSVSTLARYVL